MNIVQISCDGRLMWDAFIAVRVAVDGVFSANRLPPRFQLSSFKSPA